MVDLEGHHRDEKQRKIVIPNRKAIWPLMRLMRDAYAGGIGEC